MKPLKKIQALNALLLTVALLVSGCGGLASEPEIVRTAALPTVTPTAPPDLGHPASRVSLARGAEIFGGPQGCALCHGISGKGDGQVAANFTCKLPDFTDAEASRAKTINAWFAITSNGNNGVQQCLMPPWKGRLDEQQRWDVTSYIYSLHYTPELLAQGQKIWQDRCAACHGERGAGDGPKAKESSRPVPNFSDPAYLIVRSDTDLWKTVTNGLGNAMPAFKDELDDNARWAVVAYARSLSWEGVDQVAQAGATPAATAAATAQPDSPNVTVSGRVTNGTRGGSVPAGLALTLRIIDLSSGSPRDLQKFETKTAADGSFSFGAVPRQNNMVYVVTAQYAGTLQTSTPVRLQPGSGPLADLSFTVYEVTADPGTISIDAERIFVEPFSQDTLLIRQAVSFRNTGDRVYLTDRKVQSGDRVSVETPLPPNAQQIQLSEDVAQQYVISAGPPPTIQGIIPVLPGEAATLQFTYLLPSAGHPAINVPTLYPVEDLRIYVPQVSGFAIQDPIFTRGTPLQLQNGVYNSFQLQRPLRAGEPASFTIVDQGQQANDRRNVLAVVLFLAALVILGTIGAMWRLNRQPTPPDVSTFDKLAQSIAELDERHEQGHVPDAEYEAERSRLKAEMARLIDNP